MFFIEEFMRDPKGMLIFLLLALPGRLFALSAHECAHAYAAYRCGDPTAKMLGRMTLNPIKHIDIIGLIMMAFVGFGWARPVPVNPRNFQGNYRKSDFLVSVAGILTNLFLFLVSVILTFAVVGVALSQVRSGAAEGLRIAQLGGDKLFFSADGIYYLDGLVKSAPYLGEILIRPLWGDVPYYLFEMLSYFLQINIVLAVFNLIPIPPLDGYHVLNDLVLRRDLYASRRAQSIGMVLLIVLAGSDILGNAISWVITTVLSGAGSVFMAVFGAVGVF